MRVQPAPGSNDDQRRVRGQEVSEPLAPAGYPPAPAAPVAAAPAPAAAPVATTTTTTTTTDGATDFSKIVGRLGVGYMGIAIPDIQSRSTESGPVTAVNKTTTSSTVITTYTGHQPWNIFHTNVAAIYHF